MIRTIGKTLRTALLASTIWPASAAMAATLFGGGSSCFTYPYVGLAGQPQATSFGVGAPLEIHPGSVASRSRALNGPIVQFTTGPIGWECQEHERELQRYHTDWCAVLVVTGVFLILGIATTLWLFPG